MKSDSIEENITRAVGARFPTFGGGQTSMFNPIVNATADKPLMFAAGVDVADVVRFIVLRVRQR